MNRGVGDVASVRPGRVQLAQAAALFALWTAGQAYAQPTVFFDGAGDTVIRRTDPGNDGPFDELLHNLPDIVEMRLGRFTPTSPHIDRFAGNWHATGEFVRFDLVLAGVINPPGKVEFDDDDPDYEPFLYGPNPVFGYIEFDLDADENTGGEYDDHRHRYLGNIGRFGGVPAIPYYVDRVALSNNDVNDILAMGPFCEKSGEEFHIKLDEEIDNIEVKVERPNGNSGHFEAGEIWWVRGRYLHRAHAFDDYTFSCIDQPDRYKPLVYLRYAHSEQTDQTTISLVFPRTNVGAAALSGPQTQVQSNDGCDFNQASFVECLTDLKFSATFADPLDMQQPEFQFIAGWAAKTPANHLEPANWRATALVGSAYDTFQSFVTNAVYTDAWPSVLPGDFTGDGLIDAADDTAKVDYITLFDGHPSFDTDGDNTNLQLVWPNFSRGFCVFDVEYQGVASAAAVLLGDMDINLVVDYDDVDDFILGILQPSVYTDTHNGEAPITRGDMNLDGVLDGADFQPFVDALLGP